MEQSPGQVLDCIQEHCHEVFVQRKQDTAAFLVHLDTALDLLDRLIQHSYDRFTNIELEDGREEEGEDDTHRVLSHHIARANTIASSLLVKIVSGEILSGDDQADSDRVDRAAQLLAHLSGRGAAGAITRTWHIPYLDANGDRHEQRIRLHEPSYIGNDIGFKTWGAAPLLAKKLIQQNLIPDLATRKVLELGTGTGLVGLVCDMLGAPEVHLTDYHASVLKNVAINVDLNKSKAKVSKLDFCQVAAGEDPEWEGRKFDLVIASDLLYEMEHAENLPVAVEKLMENEFYFMIPLRDTHWDEVNRFEERMSEVGLTLRHTVDIERQDEDAVVVYRYYEFCRASVA
ncbi:putative methyltransferase-domain-containing protein [Syncephalastrum racemosum]|uniref:Putative methyltransferase-domain-containing protein n=1 Tax=Syncephalastrum racemosum TaxID=13706 RepID=A0A1X2HD08_SYNRA|nr:putative methyltransferase-domain-containing protein [Syncephalastrum racemosum]